MPRPSFIAYCATVMLVFAIRTYEPWTLWSGIAALILVAAGVVTLILVVGRRNR
jgi:uncharacterized membrane protein